MRSDNDRADIDRLKTAIRTTVASHADDDVVNPYDIATEVMRDTDLNTRYLAAHLEIRQLIRGMVRRKSDPRQPPLPHLPLVQDRYPTADGKGYIKRDLMSKEDCHSNVRQLRGRGGKLLDHANQLEQWARDYYDDYDEAVAI